MSELRRIIAVLMSLLSLGRRRAVLWSRPAPIGYREPTTDLTLYCEGDIGDGGSDSGTSGGDSGNPSDSGGGSSGGDSSGGSSSGGNLTDLAAHADTLVSFATSPIQFLRARAIPPILGAIFGFSMDLAEIVASPFDAIMGSLSLVSSSLSTATGTVTKPISDAIASGSGLILSTTAPLGPLQPFAATILTIAIAYAVLIVSLRLLRALADSIPVVSGVETFLFG